MVGVWKADLEKSKIAGPPGAPKPSNYLVIVEEKMAMFDQRTKEQAPEVIETTGVWGERGQQRSVLSVFNNGKSIVLPYQGVPTRLTAGWQSDAFVVEGEVAGRASTFKRVYKPSPDGKTMDVTIQNTTDGKSNETTLVLSKQPDSAGEPLRKPEELAETKFKNVKVDALKTLPESEFINRMHYFAWALNRNCEFCHVPRKFDSDDKKEKETARKMVEMVAVIDRDNFKGHPAVDCFTCHEGHAHPLRHNQFPEETAAEKKAIEEAAAKAAAERRALQSTPPTPRGLSSHLGQTHTNSKFAVWSANTTSTASRGNVRIQPSRPTLKSRMSAYEACVVTVAPGPNRTSDQTIKFSNPAAISQGPNGTAESNRRRRIIARPITHPMFKTPSAFQTYSRCAVRASSAVARSTCNSGRNFTAFTPTSSPGLRPNNRARFASLN